jgi:hypothetical protein
VALLTLPYCSKKILKPGLVQRNPGKRLKSDYVEFGKLDWLFIDEMGRSSSQPTSQP